MRSGGNSHPLHVWHYNEKILERFFISFKKSGIWFENMIVSSMYGIMNVSVFFKSLYEYKVKVDDSRKAHNDKKALHGAPPLVWDTTLPQHAKEWAENLVKLGRMKHSRGTGEG